MLKPEPVNEVDTSEYSRYLAAQSSKSKSEIEIAEDKKRAQERKNKEEEAKRREQEEIEEAARKKQVAGVGGKQL